MCLKCTQEYGAEKTKYDVRYINNVCFCSFKCIKKHCVYKDNFDFE